MISADTTAAADQAQAANNFALRVLAGIGAQDHRPLIEGRAGPAMVRWVTVMGRLIADGNMRVCPHASPVGTGLLTCLPWSPDTLRCAGCADWVSQAIRGTEEDRRCDGCRQIGQVGSKIWQLSTVLPATVLKVPGYPAMTLAPVLLIGGLCGPCWTAEGVTSRG